MSEPLSCSRTREQRPVDYVAYLHVTGTIASHLRGIGNDQVRRYIATQPDGSAVEPMRLRPGAVEELCLDDHPLVRRVGQFNAVGFKVSRRRGPNERRCFDRVRMERGDQVVYVLVNGGYWTEDVSMFALPATPRTALPALPPARHRERPPHCSTAAPGSRH